MSVSKMMSKNQLVAVHLHKATIRYRSVFMPIFCSRETSSGTNQWSLLLSLLPEAESARVQRFVRENDRRLALGSRLLQRALVSQASILDGDIPR